MQATSTSATQSKSRAPQELSPSNSPSSELAKRSLRKKAEGNFLWEDSAKSRCLQYKEGPEKS